MPQLPPNELPGKRQLPQVRRVDRLRASVAQLLLVARLRARNRRDLAADLLERAAHVISVTCKNWFRPSRASAAPVPPADNNNTHTHTDKGPDAHRHD